ncbi:short-chain dehydrogenase [Rhizobiales bacterium RZME27]|uniref:Short-chain dehydrogenase n=1 Tax=Endobacterium cereale TaxID=2663029 RepID=A0A6A8AH26_9HYPH|nr:short-chain dehydrogenase [Endobacterium cereale]
MDQTQTPRRGAVPRGLLQTGPVLFSYGFRPFFLGGAIWACVTMVLWIATLAGQIEIASAYGLYAWHAHEMLFGFGSAILAGFFLTAVPNWTGRLPVSGWPLAGLFSLWCLGRLAMLFPDVIGALPAATMDALFLPALLTISAREIIAGKQWKNLKVLIGLGVLTAANLGFHYEAIVIGAADYASRFGISAYITLICVIGGRIIPSFTRNWLAKQGATRFPAPFSRFDMITILASVAALLLWSLSPEGVVTAIVGCGAGALQFARLYRWRGWTTTSETLVTILHIAYLFVPFGFVAIAASALGWIDRASATHILTVGTMSAMMLAVMTRATRGHTGRQLTASKMTNLCYAAILLCALVRPLSAILPAYLVLIYASAGLFWLAAFGLYLIEYGPMLTRVRRQAMG